MDPAVDKVEWFVENPDQAKSPVVLLLFVTVVIEKIYYSFLAVLNYFIFGAPS